MTTHPNTHRTGSETATGRPVSTPDGAQPAHVELATAETGAVAFRPSSPTAPARRDQDGAVWVEVDNTHCALFGVCVQEAPQVFDLGVDGRLRYTARPAPAATAQVRQAARVCPTQAITVRARQ